MKILIVLVIGIICGVGQFFMLRFTLKPLSEGKTPQVAKMMFLQLPIPLILLLGCALVNTNLLPFAGGAFCLSLVAAAVVNHFITSKRRDDT